MPPYVIFPDKTLIEMATYFPKTPSLLRGIHGVGERKSKKYGQIFLTVINEYCQTNNITGKLVIKHRKRKKTTIKKAMFIEVGEAYKKSNSFDELLNRFGVKRNTLINHLTRYVSEGNKITTDILIDLIQIDEDKQKDIFKVFDKLGANYVKPVFDELNETVSYDDLRVLKICYINKQL